MSTPWPDAWVVIEHWLHCALTRHWQSVCYFISVSPFPKLPPSFCHSAYHSSSKHISPTSSIFPPQLGKSPFPGPKPSFMTHTSSPGPLAHSHSLDAGNPSHETLPLPPYRILWICLMWILPGNVEKLCEDWLPLLFFFFGIFTSLTWKSACWIHL